MTETDRARTFPAEDGSGRPSPYPDPGNGTADLRRVGAHPDFWYPVALSRRVRSKRVVATAFAGERIALYRGESGTVHALEDRCAHRQVPLSMGVVEGDTLRCCYHAWAYRGDGRISQIPYLSREDGRPPRGVRGYPVREAYGLVFVFPGDPDKAEDTALPELPAFGSPRYKTMTYSRTVRCHYSFMHENLLDMNHQFLHRGVVGKLHPELLDHRSDARSVEARYLFTHTGGKRNRGASLLAAEGIRGSDSSDVMTIRTAYPYQTLDLVPENAERPAFRLWAAYVPEDAEQRVCHTYGLLMIEKPRVPGALQLAWPFIRRFTERVFAEDRMAVEAEQRAWDEQGEDRNHEVFSLILDVREVLRSNGVPLPARTAACGTAPARDGRASASGSHPAG
ncbi:MULTISPECIES: aromatic ring-hydroxylating dioxygenase subunit alpha [Streptomyces]|uniref:Aromatic ring-hydroxylating dioxygenase subunit alpha n=1 Tax=Streptomyces koelreuteriae TaxID=2838015 RepID=A0ABX8FKC2_9ACTN|nr:MULTISPECIES: aromatic ring-hydroxylating dioxygenase subunit alpha [Streptomyces]QWB21525.1 aromatic ring-hydroxylating dioxygenase subunit alpha [Streptomyces koelreuteriae]UUA04447.1 aromatic ring-hydroxylating dioxygenase subunit alpha [Streptomyces koelreuteriae]UUA12072.1 aromatic ring-hydroxylating dioxygenase subunit alpha [Streptomyces sp. CRCS-T-1]